MKKRLFVSAFAMICFAAVFGGSASAISGNSVTISDGDWNICISAASYTGSSFVANVSGEGFDTQLAFGDIETESCKAITLATGGDNTVTMNVPMGVSNMSYEIDAENNKVIFSYGSLVDKYLNTYGSFESVIGASKVRIIFDANGGEGSMSSQDNLDLNTNITLTSNSFTMTNYTFDSWNTEADGSGTRYEDGDTVSFATGGEVTLYAQWYEKVAMLSTGKSVNAAIKTLANNGARTYEFHDTTVKNLEFVNELPDTLDAETTPKVDVAEEGSEPIYVYQGEGDHYYIYSEANKIVANEDSSYLFSGLTIGSLVIPSYFDTSNVVDMSYMFNDMNGISSLVLPENMNTEKLENMSYMFSKMYSMPSITFPNSFDTSNVINMSGLFSNDYSLATINYPSVFDTSSVTDMSYMFSELYKNTFNQMFPEDGFDTSKVTDMNHMFSGALVYTLTLPEDFDTSSVTDMSYMFSDMRNLQTLSLPDGFDTSSVTDMSYMFNNMYSARAIIFSDVFDTSRVTDMSYMFCNTYSVQSLDLSNYDTSEVKNMSHMFDSVYSIGVIDLPDTFVASNVINMDSMFVNLYSLQVLYLPDTFTINSSVSINSLFSNINSMAILFRAADNTAHSLWPSLYGPMLVNGSNFNTSLKTDANSSSIGLYEDDNAIKSLQFVDSLPDSIDENVTPKINLSTNSYVPIYAYQATSGNYYIYTEAEKMYYNTDSSHMFQHLNGLSSLSLPSMSVLDSSKVANMAAMFASMSKITSLSLPDNFNTSAVTDMAAMFQHLNKLTALTLPSSFNTSNVTDMYGMFWGDTSLLSLILPDAFNTQKVTDMTLMFGQMEALTELALPDVFNTSNVASMQQMFAGMVSLNTLTFSSTFYTSKVTDMSYMFDNDISLTALTLPDVFNTINVTNMAHMFGGLLSLTSLTLPASFNTSNVTSMNSMFYGIGFEGANPVYINSLVTLTLPDAFVIKSGTDTSGIFENLYSATLYATDATARSLWPGVLGN